MDRSVGDWRIKNTLIPRQPTGGAWHVILVVLTTAMVIQAPEAVAQSLPIAFGETRTGSIDLPSEMDAYTFTGQAADVVIIRVGEVEEFSWPFDPAVDLYSSDGTLLCSSDYHEEVVCSLGSAGVYTIIVSDEWSGDGTGSYQVHLQRLNLPFSTTPIAYGDSRSGSIEGRVHMDAYTFDAEAGDAVIVACTSSVRLYAPDGAALCSDYPCFLDLGGTYSIFVVGANGDYDLHLQQANEPGYAISIAFGETRSGSIDSAHKMDAYTLTGQAGDVVIIRVGEVEEFSWPFDPAIDLYSPDGTLLCSSDYHEEVVCSLGSAGVYTIIVSDEWAGDDTGSYQVHLQRLNLPGNATPIAFGETRSGSIDGRVHMDAYTFEGEVGDAVLIGATSSVRLYGPDGTRLCSEYGLLTEGPCFLENSGGHTIFVVGADGTYTLSLACVTCPPPPPETFSITSIFPNRGGNAGSVTLTIHGGVFDQGATVRLERTGEAAIPSGAVSVIDEGLTLVTTFNLTNRAPDAWDVAVSNPDGESALFAAGFTVEEGGSPQMWVDITGRNQVRIGRETEYLITYGNSGNVDAYGAVLFVAIRQRRSRRQSPCRASLLAA